jgi:hypothetical protein
MWRTRKTYAARCNDSFPRQWDDTTRLAYCSLPTRIRKYLRSSDVLR